MKQRLKNNGDCILEGNTVDKFGTETYEPSMIGCTGPPALPGILRTRPAR